MRTVKLYTKEGCHLCEEALAVIERVRAEVPFELVECEITRDERLHRAFFDRIPVVEVDDEQIFQYTVDEALLREALLQGCGSGDGPDRASPSTR